MESDLWPIAILYAAYINNHNPINHVFPADVFCGNVFPRRRLEDLKFEVVLSCVES